MSDLKSNGCSKKNLNERIKASLTDGYDYSLNKLYLVSVLETPLLVEGGVPKGRGGFSKFAESENLKSQPSVAPPGSFAATPPYPRRGVY